MGWKGSAKPGLGALAATNALTERALNAEQSAKCHGQTHGDERGLGDGYPGRGAILCRIVWCDRVESPAHTPIADPRTMLKRDGADHERGDLPGQPMDEQCTNQRKNQLPANEVEHMHNTLLSGGGHAG